MSKRYRRTEVLVVGGGATGICAAIAAARMGRDTLIVERYGFLGGMFTGGNMTVLNCYPVGGIGKEIVEELASQGDARMCPDDPPNYPVFHYASEYSTMNVLYDAEAAKLVVMDLVREAGARSLLHSYVYETLTQGARVVGVELCNKGGIETVLADVIIDATADADIAARAGFGVRKGQGEEGTLFAMTMLVRLGNVDWPGVSRYSEGDPGFDRAIAEAIDRGELPYYRPRTREMVNYTGHARPELSHLVRPNDALLWGGTVEGVDGTNAEDLTRAEFECRDQFRSELALLKKRVPGFAEATVEATGHQVGVRDTRHIVGLSTMTPADILEQRRYDDVVAYNVKGASPVNDIRYGCLVPADSHGLLVCGNGISVLPGSTQMGIVLGSYNNIKDIPSMWTTGEAAGVAAALCCARGSSPAEVDVGEVQERLKSVGALIDDKERERRMEQQLPSGRTFGQFYQEQLQGMISYWEGRGQYERD